MRFAVPIAFATATAVSIHGLPVRAFPDASVNLIRINDRGALTPLPGLRIPAQATSPQETEP